MGTCSWCKILNSKDWHAAHYEPQPSCRTMVPILTFGIRWKLVVSFRGATSIHQIGVYVDPPRASLDVAMERTVATPTPVRTEL
jgi:hypothetical protein